MRRIEKYIKRPGLLLGMVAIACAAYAQDREKFDSLAARYKNQHAVYTKIDERLEITVDDGVLAANSHTTLEKLFLSDQSLNNYNMDYFFYSDFNDLTALNGNAYLPAKGKEYRKVACSGFGSGSPRSYVFYDDLRYMVAYYAGLTKNAVTET